MSEKRPWSSGSLGNDYGGLSLSGGLCAAVFNGLGTSTVRVAKPGIPSTPPDTTISFEGEPVQARSGESVAAALVSSGHYGCRTTRGSGDRGVFCGMGICNECAVTINGNAGRLACMEKITPGMSVDRSQPLRFLHDDAAMAIREELICCDVLVIGAGPGGLQAALSAARSGAQVVVVDERSSPGGQYFKQPASSIELDADNLDHQYRSGRQLFKSVREAGVDIRLGTRVWGATGPREMFAITSESKLILRTGALILATGAYERGVPFPGWTLPGVMTTGAAQTLLRSYLVASGDRVLISGNGPLNLQVAAELTRAKATVVAVAEAAPLWRATNLIHSTGMLFSNPRNFAEGLSYMKDLMASKVPILSRSAVIEVRGDGRAEEAVVARLDALGRVVPGTENRYDVDSVCLGYGFIASSELARSLGCAHHFDVRTNSLVIERDWSGQTSIEGVWVIGDGGSIRGAQVAQAMGALAGAQAASSVVTNAVADKRLGRKNRRALARHERFQHSLWRQFRAPRLLDQLATPETIICRCEEIRLAQLQESAEPWLAAAGSLKRVTRAGMGKCQGRYCSPILTELASRVSGVEPGLHAGFFPQVPFSPVPASLLADTLEPLEVQRGVAAPRNG